MDGGEGRNLGEVRCRFSLVEVAMSRSKYNVRLISVLFCRS